MTKNYMTDPVISLVIIEYFSLEEINACISGISENLKGISYEIIISSNSRYNESEQEHAQKKYPSVVFCFNDRNGGFAYGMNRGLEMARGRYLAILNPDAIVLNGFNSLIGFMDSYGEIGAVGPQLINSKGTIQDSCRKYVSLPRYIGRQIKRRFRDIPIIESGIDHNLIQTVDWLSGAFIVVRREVYKATNGLDENYFLYAEDLDWCTRIRNAGWEIAYFPNMRVSFSGSRAARRINNYTWIFIKSHLIYWRKFGFFSGYPVRKEIIFDKMKYSNAC